MQHRTSNWNGTIAATVALALGTASGLVAAAPQGQTDSVRYGVDGYLEDQEKEGEFEPDPDHPGGTSGESFASGESFSNEGFGQGGFAMQSNSSGQDRAYAPPAPDVPPDCTWAKIIADGTNGKYNTYTPGVYIKLRLDLRTNTFTYNPPNLDSCQRRWYYSSNLRHSGAISRNNGNVIMVSGSATRDNEAYLSSSHQARYSGNLAVEPDDRRSSHYATLRNGNVISTTTSASF